MLDVAASMIRGHGFGGDAVPSPAVPEVPAEYRSSASASASESVTSPVGEAVVGMVEGLPFTGERRSTGVPDVVEG